MVGLKEAAAAAPPAPGHANQDALLANAFEFFKTLMAEGADLRLVREERLKEIDALETQRLTLETRKLELEIEFLEARKAEMQEQTRLLKEMKKRQQEGQ